MPVINSLESVQTNNDSLLISWTISVPYEAYTLQLNISNDDGYSLYDVYGLTMYELHKPNPCITYYISLTLQLNVSCTAFRSIASNFIAGLFNYHPIIGATINISNFTVAASLHKNKNKTSLIISFQVIIILPGCK